MSDLSQAELQSLQRAYALVFGRGEERGPAVVVVLRDLASFCSAHASSFEPPGNLERFEGRREVWLRLQAFLHIPNDELWGRLREPQLRYQQYERNLERQVDEDFR